LLPRVPESLNVVLPVEGRLKSAIGLPSISRGFKSPS
jgi:hypothetical protein